MNTSKADGKKVVTQGGQRVSESYANTEDAQAEADRINAKQKLSEQQGGKPPAQVKTILHG